MKELSQLVQIIDKNKPRHIEVLGNEEASSNHAQLYELLRGGQISTDEEAAKHFYGSAKAVGQSAYRQFKSRFKERLINTLFFIDKDSNEATDLQNATMYIQKEWAAINIIYTKGDMHLASKLAEDLLPYAVKYELTEIVIYIADRLRQAYGTQIDNRHRYLELKQLQDDYMEVWRLEILAREIFHDIRMDYIKSTVIQMDTIEKAWRGWGTLQPHLEKIGSYQFLTYSYFVALAQFTNSIEDLQKTIDCCDAAITLLSNKKFNPKIQIAIFMNQKIRCLTQLKEGEAGEKVIKVALSLQEEGSMRWFKTLEHQTLLALQTKEYGKAFQIWKDVQEHKAFKKLKLQHFEIWQLFSAYLHFLAKSGKIDAEAMKQSNYRASKFVNDIPTFSLDKEGMNVPSLIIQIAILIAEKKLNAIPDRLEALGKYWQRHIRKTDNNYRSYCFIKMLQELPKANYKRVGLEARTKIMLRDLVAVPVNLEVPDFKSEVMPLEDLWAILLGLM
jgi:hypothetical protein